jgi:predicted dehydrogenase
VVALINAERPRKEGEMMEKLRLGGRGCGSIMETHLEVIFQHVPDIEVVARCDINEKITNRLGNKYKIKSRYVHYQELLKRRDIDAVDIAVRPEEPKPEIVRAATEVKKYIFLEKAMAVNVKSAEEMAAAIRRRRRDGYWISPRAIGRSLPDRPHGGLGTETAFADAA